MADPIAFSAAQVDITPDRPLPLGGISLPHGEIRSRGIDGPLEANLLLLRGKAGHIVLLSIDCLFPGPDLAGDLMRASARLQANDRVLALATHVHTAPMLDRSKPQLGHVDSRWYQCVVSRVAAGIDAAFDRLASGATVSTAWSTIEGSINRRREIRRPVLRGRRLILSGTIMGPNPLGLRSPICRSAILRYDDGRIGGVLVNWACHPSDRPVLDRVSPDYIGNVRSTIRALLGDCPVLFLQGFSGDVRAAIGMRPTARRILRRLVRGPVFMVPTAPEWDAWARDIGRQIRSVVGEAARSPEHPISRLAVTDAELELDFLLGEGAGGRCHAHILTLGDHIRLFMITAEVSAAFAPQVEALGLWPIGCLGNVFGYFPTDEQIRKGGYEVEEFQAAFGVAGRFLGRNDAAFKHLLEHARTDQVADPSEVSSQAGSARLRSVL